MPQTKAGSHQRLLLVTRIPFFTENK